MNVFLERAETPWIPPTNLQLIGTFCFAAYCAYFANFGQQWVHLLDSANLMFHEAGHPIYGLLFGQGFMVYGGTLGQLTFPIVGAVAFWLRREANSFSFMLIWLCENLWNIARYLADARIQVLPLVGGGEHDWTEILSHWGVLTRELSIAHSIRVFAWIGVVVTLAWLLQTKQSQSTGQL